MTGRGRDHVTLMACARGSRLVIDHLHIDGIVEVLAACLLDGCGTRKGKSHASNCRMRREMQGTQQQEPLVAAALGSPLLIQSSLLPNAPPPKRVRYTVTCNMVNGFMMQRATLQDTLFFRGSLSSLSVWQRKQTSPRTRPGTRRG